MEGRKDFNVSEKFIPQTVKYTSHKNDILNAVFMTFYICFA